MTTQLERRIAAVARERGCSFYEAASLLAKRRGARLRSKSYGAARREHEALTRVRKTWWWAREFDL